MTTAATGLARAAGGRVGSARALYPTLFGGLGAAGAAAGVTGHSAAVIAPALIAGVGAAVVRRLRRQLAYRSSHDPLTGLAGRAPLLAALERGDGPKALMIIDLDGFRDVNDAIGHQAGDLALVDVARRLSGVLGADCLLARLGGDEFAVLLTGAGVDTATATAERVLDAMRTPYAGSAGTRYLLTASIGVLAEVGGRTPSAALRDADLALETAKSTGRNRLVAFEPGMRNARLDLTRLTTGLRRAVVREEFTLHYQPVIDLTSGATYAVEALLRWTPPGQETVPPDAFIPAAEDTGLIVPIGEWVLDRACEQAGEWFAKYGVAVTVNVSGHQLRDPDFVPTVKRILTRHDLPGRALVLEITETVLVTETAAATDTVTRRLAQLREHGVGIAIDDFGTGYSSLSYLRSLPVDVLKIDRSFTASAGAEQPRLHEWAFTRAILEMSASLGLKTVAEGVENAEQARLLRRMNCTFAQGFHFDRPMPASDVDALLAATPRRPPAVRMPRRVPSHRPLEATEGIA